jgi:hypothetical protein
MAGRVYRLFSTARMAPAISLIRIGFITSARMPFSLARR